MSKIAAAAALLAAYAAVPARADIYYPVYQGRRDVVRCDGRPIALMGSHSGVRLVGPCPAVRVAGAHNDVAVPILPGGVIEVTAPHNDVTWRQEGPGPAPRLLQLAPSVTFHHR